MLFYNKIDFVQIGCGGTGSYLVAPLCKFISNLKLRFGDEFSCTYYLVDDDFVEDRNVIRQNFNYDHIGQLKTESLKFENSYINERNIIRTIQQKLRTQIQLTKFFDYYFDDVIIILGCVDDNKSRREIFKFIKDNSYKRIIYIDSGNNLHNGQIITSVFNPFVIEKLTRNNQYDCIDFNKKFKLKKAKKEESCAFFGDQSQSVNMFAATLLFINIQKILINSVLPPNTIEFNSSGYSTFNI